MFLLLAKLVFVLVELIFIILLKFENESNFFHKCIKKYVFFFLTFSDIFCKFNVTFFYSQLLKKMFIFITC